MERLLVVRHGQSEQHVRDVTGGWTDTRLTAVGRRQAEATAERLAGLLEGQEFSFLSSDLARAVETAQIIGDRLGVKPVLREGLREFNNGRAAGLTRSEAGAIGLPVTKPVIDYVPYPDAESWRTMAERVWSFMDSAEGELRDTTLAVGHGNSGQVLVHWWLRHCEECRRRIAYRLDQCSITELGVSEWGERVILRLNDTSHLAGPPRG
jgi:broad specificity phosphatase PhoE